MNKQQRKIADVLRDHTPDLLAIEGVIGTAIGSVEGQPGILITVTEKTAALTASIPKQLEGHPVRILRTGGASLSADD